MVKLQKLVPDDMVDLSDAEIIERVVEEQLPEWKKLCQDTRASTVLLHQSAFGQSVDELLLMAIGIKYAGLLGKDVVVGTSNPQDSASRAKP